MCCPHALMFFCPIAIYSLLYSTKLSKKTRAPGGVKVNMATKRLGGGGGGGCGRNRIDPLIQESFLAPQLCQWQRPVSGICGVFKLLPLFSPNCVHEL